MDLDHCHIILHHDGGALHHLQRGGQGLQLKLEESSRCCVDGPQRYDAPTGVFVDAFLMDALSAAPSSGFPARSVTRNRPSAMLITGLSSCEQVRGFSIFKIVC